MAQIYMGKMYENGWGVEKSKKKSEEWYKKAERQGLTPQLIQQLQQKKKLQLQKKRLSNYESQG